MVEAQLIEKMNRVVSSLSKKGSLKLFALNWRGDMNQWDILVSADWIDYEKLRDNLSDIFQELKKEFNGQYALLFSGIHPLVPSEPLVQSINKAFPATNEIMNLERVQFGTLVVEKMILFVSRT
jgi:hypothetical protein